MQLEVLLAVLAVLGRPCGGDDDKRINSTKLAEVLAAEAFELGANPAATRLWERVHKLNPRHGNALVHLGLAKLRTQETETEAAAMIAAAFESTAEPSIPRDSYQVCIESTNTRRSNARRVKYGFRRINSLGPSALVTMRHTRRASTS